MLDTVGAIPSCAYALRRISSTYRGPLITVRRSSDNVQRDIYYRPDGSLDITDLLAFVGAGNGFVTTWYDQTPRRTNLTQVTATLQPTIVSAGALLLRNGRPAILYNAASINLNSATVSPFPLGITSYHSCVVTQDVANTATTYPGIFSYSASGTNDYSAGLTLDIIQNTGLTTFNSLRPEGVNYPPTPPANIMNQSYAFGTPTVIGLRAYPGTLQTNLIQNGVLGIAATQAAATVPSTQKFLIGSRWYTGVVQPLTFWRGTVNEYIMFNTMISPADESVLTINQGQYYGVAVAT